MPNPTLTPNSSYNELQLQCRQQQIKSFFKKFPLFSLLLFYATDVQAENIHYNLNLV